LTAAIVPAAAMFTPAPDHLRPPPSA
jgi:hypothetical protein